MLDLLLTPKARLDLEEIYEYSFRVWGVTQADLYQDQLFHFMQLICKNPFLGTNYSYSSIAYRKLTANKHLIFYRLEKSSIIVVRILHEKMDILPQIEKK